jgi:hypothetical protein
MLVVVRVDGYDRCRLDPEVSYRRIDVLTNQLFAVARLP